MKRVARRDRARRLVLTLEIWIAVGKRRPRHHVDVRTRHDLLRRNVIVGGEDEGKGCCSKPPAERRARATHGLLVQRCTELRTNGIDQYWRWRRRRRRARTAADPRPTSVRVPGSGTGVSPVSTVKLSAKPHAPSAQIPPL